MEWSHNLRRSQSLRSLPAPCDNPTSTEAGLRDRKASVSQLVARYQTRVEVSTSIEIALPTIATATTTAASCPHVVTQLDHEPESKPKALLRTKDEKERFQAKTSLTRTKSMGSLQNSDGGVEALRSLFEPKAGAPCGLKSRMSTASLLFPPIMADLLPADSMEAEERDAPLQEQKGRTPANDCQAHAEKDKVVNKTWIERRKTIGGIDLEKMMASQADVKRRSTADLRDASLIQTREKLPISVKAISALYLSKVAGAEPAGGLLRPAQGKPSESGKQGKPTKMEGDGGQRSQQMKNPCLSAPLAEPHPGGANICGACTPPAPPYHPSREMLYQQRQKCELRRLLKHTHPELSTLDVDEELAEVLSSECRPTADETGYEGEVLNRRWIFENHALSSRAGLHAPKMHVMEGTVERGGDVKRTSALFEQPCERPHVERVKWGEGSERHDCNPDVNAECGEERVRVDVQSTKKMFETQSVVTSRSCHQDKFQGKVEDEAGPFPRQKQVVEMCSQHGVHGENKKNACINSVELSKWSQKHERGPCAHVVGPSAEDKFSETELHMKEASAVKAVLTSENQSPSFPHSQSCGIMIKTSAALYQNNPFIATNVEREQSQMQGAKGQSNISPYGDPTVDSGGIEDILTANVKNRAQLFESVSFDKIRQQNKEEIEAMLESINETLNCLCNFDAIHSDGLIIEVNETMLAKKARYKLFPTGPEIQYDELAEGGAQNFILHSLPRAKLKPEVIYLKENDQGNVITTVVDVPIHQHQFTANQDAEFKTANIVQLIEDILNQDNSLRKGIIIQENVNRSAEVTVYSLYRYLKGEVKSYSPPQVRCVEHDESECTSDENKSDIQEITKGDVKSTISCLLAANQEPAYPGSMKPEIKMKGNVKLLSSCIEKGDLEYLKTLHADPTEQQVSPNQYITDTGVSTETCSSLGNDTADESDSQWIPVDVKRLKNLFSTDQSHIQSKHVARDEPVQPLGLTCQSPVFGERETSAEYNMKVISGALEKSNSKECSGQSGDNKHDLKVSPPSSCLYLETKEEDMVHQAELVEVLDDEDEIFSLQAAIHNLQQATLEAKALHLTTLVKRQLSSQGLSKQHTTSTIKCDVKTVENPEGMIRFPQENMQKEKTCNIAMLKQPCSASYIEPGHKSESQNENMEADCAETHSEKKQTIEACGTEGQQGTEFVQKEHLKANILPLQVVTNNTMATKQDQEDKENIVRSNLQVALDSLERSCVNVTRGDIRAAMIYRCSAKSHKDRYKNVDAGSAQKPIEEGLGPLTESESTLHVTHCHMEVLATEELSETNAESPSLSQTQKKPAKSTTSKTTSRTAGPKPAIPPKPDHLRAKPTDNRLTNSENLSGGMQTKALTNEIEKSKEGQHLQTSSTSLFDTDSAAESRPSCLELENHKTNELDVEKVKVCPGIQLNHQAQGSKVTTVDNNNTQMDEKIVSQPENMNVAADQESQNYSVKGNGNEADESHVTFSEACQKFGGKQGTSAKNIPMKPKRVRIAQSEIKKPEHISGDNNSAILTRLDAKTGENPTALSYSKPSKQEQTFDRDNKQKRDAQPEGKVVMRYKKVKVETEEERRQRLSVHMDEIMRGNMMTAIEIFDNLRKQEQLQNILTNVEKIEQDTSDVDASSLKKIFENVPDWVVAAQAEKQKQTESECRVERSSARRDERETVSSMAHHVFGDLERASEEILNLKEQTLARLMDIEEAIKKALYSVSTLKSESDIAGLSGLFKESLETVQRSSTSGNISKISIGSSRKKTQQSLSPQQCAGLPRGQISSMLDVPSPKLRASPPSSPAFISIQSAAKKKDNTCLAPSENTTICSACQCGPKMKEKFRTTKTLKCNSPCQYKKKDAKEGRKQSPPNSPLNPRRELSVLEVQTDPSGNSIISTRMVTENYEKMDGFGNRFYSTKTSTVVATQPETVAISRDQVVTSPATFQVATYPEIKLPISKP